MNDDIKQLQGIKRSYDATTTAANGGYQPVAKKKKGDEQDFFVSIECLWSSRCTSRWHNSSWIDSYHDEIIGTDNDRHP